MVHRFSAPTAVLVATLLLIVGCSSKRDEFVNFGLNRMPETGITLDRSQITTDEGMEKFAAGAIEQIRTKWDRFAYGSVIDNPPSFTVKFIKQGEQVTASCDSWSKMDYVSLVPAQCGATLFVPLGGLAIQWDKLQKSEFKNYAHESLFLLLAAALGDYYSYSLKQFAKNVFREELSAPRDKPAFAQCIAGMITYWNFPHKTETASKDWQIDLLGFNQGERVVIEAGYDNNPADCYQKYWM